jgi:hypothetical protein
MPDGKKGGSPMKNNNLYMAMLFAALSLPMVTFGVETATYHTPEEQDEIATDVANVMVTHAPVTEPLDDPEVRELSVGLKALRKSKSDVIDANRGVARASSDNAHKALAVKAQAEATHRQNINDVKNTLAKITRMVNADSKAG